MIESIIEGARFSIKLHFFCQISIEDAIAEIGAIKGQGLAFRIVVYIHQGSLSVAHVPEVGEGAVSEVITSS